MFSKNDHFSISRFNKIMSIFGFMLILSTLSIIIHNSSANVYNFSIYESYPEYFWALIIIALFIGQIILLNSAFSKSKTNSWIAGFLIIIISDLILLLMPIIKGYFVNGRYDALTHIGYMVDIGKYHNIGSNPYPILHIWGFVLNYMSGLSYNDISMLIPAFLSLFYIFSWYLLGRLVFKKNNMILFMLSMSSILLFGSKNSMLSPNGETLLFVPFFLYIFFKSRVAKKPIPYEILLILISFFVVFSHPLISILLIMTLIISDYPIFTTVKWRKSNYIVLIILCCFLMWSSYIPILTNNIKLILDNMILYDGTGSELGRYSNSLNSIHIPFLYIVIIGLRLYGLEVLLGVLSLICISLVFIFWKKYHVEVDYYHKFSIVGWLFFVLLSLLILIFADSFGFIRIYQYSILFSIMLIPLSINMLLERTEVKEKKHHFKLLPLLSLFLLLITYFSTYNLFFAPINLNIDQQTPESEFSGMEVFYHVKNNSQPTLELGITNFRVYDAVYGVAEGKKEKIRYTNPVIEHFDYTSNSSINSYYNETSYLLISDVGRYQKQKLFPDLKSEWDFTPKDFNKLNNDAGVTKFYSNKFLEMYIINH
ncbi:hypothetical protein [Methanosarcina vacuolata]|uniref:Glycosyltransferase RgtA/B/C/D-like domain-containing protein n=1 Tax=Methanosarcina vacuolata Z-761 TaxID=1434123 RepID=A0A0E3Q3P4_9EURY|nr:hypothetical protein [Methanosarcina vacuolata]AKB43112.1 hypothetical protein MSVAZ_0843 [Methanosarcina vacuolata Z-761]